MTTPYGLGCIPQLPDIRDYSFKSLVARPELPSAVDLVAQYPQAFPAIQDQGQLGACTAFGTNRAQYYAYVRDGWHNPFIQSHLFQYYNARMLEGTTASDSGASIRDAVKAGAQFGMCAEHFLPYDPSIFANRPPQAAYDNATRHATTVYEAVPATVEGIQAALGSGFPVVLGLAVYQSFFNAPGGHIPLPQTGEQLAGGHCLTITAYNNQTQEATFANSWSAGWGTGGYGFLPYPYFTPQLVYDAWVIRVQK